MASPFRCSITITSRRICTRGMVGPRRGWSVSGRWRGAQNLKKTGVVRVRTSRLSEWPAPMQTNEFPMVDVLRLRPLEGHRLWVRFTDGSEGVRDLSPVIAAGGPMLEPLKSPEYFARVF